MCTITRLDERLEMVDDVDSLYRPFRPRSAFRRSLRGWPRNPPPLPISRCCWHAARRQGCINLSELDEQVAALDLTDEELEALHERIDTLGIRLTDDCGREGMADTHFKLEDLNGTTTDALQLFLNEIRRHPLLTRPRSRARQAHRAGRPRGQGADDHLQPAAGVSIAKKYQGQSSRCST